MKKALMFGMCLTVVLLVLASATAPAAEKPAVATIEVGGNRVSGPYTHKNLSIFIVRGKDTITGNKYMTLDEALEKKLAVLNETGNVQELTIENNSDDVHLYLQSGIIVKGGRQDRTIQYDMVIPPKSGKVAVSSFCVESGRWSKRGSENSQQFASAKQSLATKELRYAARSQYSQQQSQQAQQMAQQAQQPQQARQMAQQAQQQSQQAQQQSQQAQQSAQQEVWKGVQEAQDKLSKNLEQNVRDAKSASSLQLTLENPEVQKAAAEYVKALSGTFADGKDIIGYAFAINGEINTADVYGSHDLFEKLMPKLLESAAIEAIAKVEKEKKFKAPTVDAVRELMLNAEKGKATDKDLTNGVKMTVKESEEVIQFRTYDKKEPALQYRKEIMNKK